MFEFLRRSVEDGPSRDAVEDSIERQRAIRAENEQYAAQLGDGPDGPLALDHMERGSIMYLAVEEGLACTRCKEGGPEEMKTCASVLLGLNQLVAYPPLGPYMVEQVYRMAYLQAISDVLNERVRI